RRPPRKKPGPRKGGERESANRRASERYHDRVAARYDQVYGGAYWDVYERLSWEGIKPHVPTDLSARIVDLGCGTGLYGLKLLKSGYRVTFLDLSEGMLEQARRKAAELPGNAASRATFIKDDLGALSVIEMGAYDLAIAQGDPICHAGRDAEAAFTGSARVLKPGGVLVASLDNQLAGIDHYLEKGDAQALERFLRTGITEWLTRKEEERFSVRMFRPAELGPLCKRAGLELLDLFGKPVLPLRRYQALLEDPESRRAFLKIERRLSREPALLGRAAHLQLAARRIGPES
ncbi:MAG: class I SAM-dependent DNA methyltransferase, partial [Planctomycetota bacterium]